MASYTKIELMDPEDALSGVPVEVEAPDLPEPEAREAGVIYTNADGLLCRFDGRRVRLVSPAELD